MSGETSAQKVHLTGAQETLLVTLYAKALDSRSSHPLLNDKMADSIVRSVDYDFGRMAGFGDSRITVIRAAHYDAWVRAFIGNQPACCGGQPRRGSQYRVARI